MLKPNKGIIEAWFINKIGEDEFVWGTVFDNPKIPDFGWTRTSPIVRRKGRQVEPRNSLYELGEPIEVYLGDEVLDEIKAINAMPFDIKQQMRAKMLCDKGLSAYLEYKISQKQ